MAGRSCQHRVHSGKKPWGDKRGLSYRIVKKASIPETRKGEKKSFLEKGDRIPVAGVLGEKASGAKLYPGEMLRGRRRERFLLSGIHTRPVMREKMGRRLIY